jgi:hypothetical protein
VDRVAVDMGMVVKDGTGMVMIGVPRATPIAVEVALTVAVVDIVVIATELSVIQRHGRIVYRKWTA